MLLALTPPSPPGEGEPLYSARTGFPPLDELNMVIKTKASKILRDEENVLLLPGEKVG